MQTSWMDIRSLTGSIQCQSLKEWDQSRRVCVKVKEGPSSFVSWYSYKEGLLVATNLKEEEREVMRLRCKLNGEIRAGLWDWKAEWKGSLICATCRTDEVVADQLVDSSSQSSRESSLWFSGLEILAPLSKDQPKSYLLLWVKQQNLSALTV